MHDVDSRGFAILPSLFSEAEISAFLECLSPEMLSGAGYRGALSNLQIRRLANDPRLVAIARSVLGPGTIPFRATLFSKTESVNWHVFWHQDKVLPLRSRKEVAGWGPWSVKAGVIYANAPATALEKIVALRVHLDDCLSANGALKVLPGTHRLGILNHADITKIVAITEPIECELPGGGVMLMSPLLVHSSCKSSSSLPRRVVHIEYAAALGIEDGLELAGT